MPYMDNRLQEVFQCIVESYIETAEPVGSRTISKRYYGSLSPASIRNVMADLEEMGMISQPHTSAGRVPTEKGYRQYVDSILKSFESSSAESVVEEVADVRALLRNARSVEEAAELMSRVLSDLTQNAGITLMRNVRRISSLMGVHDRQRLFEEIEGDVHHRLYVFGTSHLLEQPEFHDALRFASVLRALELKEELSTLLSDALHASQVHIRIGSEVGYEGLNGVSLISREYSINGVPVGCVGVIGPTRMQYTRVINAVNRLGDMMTEFLSGE